ncbi:hypothetical protein V2G26_011645 [Clonostachys chloroleuca]
MYVHMCVCVCVCRHADRPPWHAGKRGDEERKRSSCAMVKTALPWESVPGRREVHEKSAECWLAALERARDCLLLLVLAAVACALQRDIHGRYDGGPKASAYRALVIPWPYDATLMHRNGSLSAEENTCMADPTLTPFTTSAILPRSVC